ncbi:MAG: right-handed parallel beta-helix repeat-containing protein [Polyangiaceae bacterium]
MRGLSLLRRTSIAAFSLSPLFFSFAVLSGCSSEDSSTNSTAGAAGSSGTAGSAGSGGTAGSGGASGSSGSSGSGGTSGASGSAGSGGTGGSADCPAGQWAPSGTTCVDAGIAPDGCDAGFLFDAAKGCVPVLPATDCDGSSIPILGETTCQPVGPAAVGTSSCPASISVENNGVCDVVLPSQPCAPGTLALPGETSCHAVDDCGAGDWGNIPIDASTQFVKQSYSGANGASDGSQSRPWTTISQAISAASAGSIVAVSDGAYAESVQINAHPVRLWGRCSSKVSVSATSAAAATIAVTSQSNSEIHGLSITGSATNGGVVVSGAENVKIDHVYVHDNSAFGVIVQSFQGAASVAISSSLIASNRGVGVYVTGATATFDQVAVQDTLPRSSDQSGGQGVVIQANTSTMTASNATLSSSLISGNHAVGLVVMGAKVDVDGTVIRNTLPQASDSQFGEGVQVLGDATSQLDTELTLTESVLDANHEVGLLLFGGKASLEASVVENTQPRATDQANGRGISAQRLTGSNQEPELNLSHCLLAKNRSSGLLSFGVSTTVFSTIVRDTLAQASDMTGGQGIAVLRDSQSMQAGDLMLNRALITGNLGFGLLLQGSKAHVNKTAILDTAPRESDQGFGWGVLAQVDSTSQTSSELSLNQSIVSKSTGAGVVATGSSITVEGSLVRDTQAQVTDSTRGWGVVSNLDTTTQKPSDVTLTKSVITNHHDIGLLVNGSNATLDGTVISQITPKASDSTGGRALVVQTDATASTPSKVVLKGSLLTANASDAIFALRSSLEATGTAIRDNPSAANGSAWGALLYQSTTLSLTSSVVKQNTSGGVYVVGSTLSASKSLLECNGTKDIYGQTLSQDFNSGQAITPITPTFNNGGENLCGCDATIGACVMTTAN